MEYVLLGLVVYLFISCIIMGENHVHLMQGKDSAVPMSRFDPSVKYTRDDHDAPYTSPPEGEVFLPVAIIVCATLALTLILIQGTT